MNLLLIDSSEILLDGHARLTGARATHVRAVLGAGAGGALAGLVLALVVLGTAGVAAWRWATRVKPVEVQTAAATERAAGVQAQPRPV